MAGDGASRNQYRRTLRAVGEITSVKGNCCKLRRGLCVFRKLQDSYAGESVDDIYAVAGQLKRKVPGDHYYVGKL